MHEIKVLQNGFVGKISGIIFDYSDLNRKLLPRKQKKSVKLGIQEWLFSNNFKKHPVSKLLTFHCLNVFLDYLNIFFLTKNRGQNNFGNKIPIIHFEIWVALLCSIFIEVINYVTYNTHCLPDQLVHDTVLYAQQCQFGYRISLMGGPIKHDLWHICVIQSVSSVVEFL